MKQQNKSKLEELLLHSKSSIEDIQKEIRLIITESLDSNGLTAPQRRAIEAICSEVVVPLSVGIETSNTPIISTPPRKKMLPFISNVTIPSIIALLSILLFFGIIPLGISVLITVLSLYIAINSFILHRKPQERALQLPATKLVVKSTVNEIEDSIDELISHFNCIIKEIKKNTGEKPPFEDPLMGSHLEILKWTQRLYNNAVRLEKIGTERFREDISYILDLFDYTLKPYSPEDSEYFNIEHITMENKEPNTVTPAIFHRNGSKEEIILKGKVFLPK